jgi:hypothetical protein
MKPTTIGNLAAPALLLLACGGGTPQAQPQPHPTATATTTPPPPTAAPDAGAPDQTDAAPPPQATDTSAHRVAGVQVATSAIAVDESSLYYIDLGDGSVNAVAPTGGTRTTLYSSPGTVTGTPWLTQDSGTLYFVLKVQDDSGSTSGTVYRFEKGGDQPQKLGGGYKDDFNGIAVDATSVFFVSGHIIFQVPLKGGPVPAAASGSGADPTSLATDADTLYWTTDGTVFKASKKRTGPQLLASAQPQASNIQLDGTTAYWVVGGKKLVKAAKAGGPTSTVVEADGAIADFSIDGATIYFATPNAIMKVPAAGGTAEKVTDAATPLGIAVDATSIYWASKGTDAKQYKDGAIMAKAK